jgi:uncharacterized protein involved in exopolysaccharide biosynthesis
MDSALLPDRPMPRHVFRNAFISGVLGFLLSAMAVLALNALATVRRTLADASIATSSHTRS